MTAPTSGGLSSHGSPDACGRSFLRPGLGVAAALAPVVGAAAAAVAAGAAVAGGTGTVAGQPQGARTGLVAHDRCRGPGLVHGHVCPDCAAAIFDEGSVGPSAIGRAVIAHLRRATPGV